MYVFKEFTPASMLALIESDIKRYASTVEDRRIGKEFQRGKIAALVQLRYLLENCRIETPMPPSEPEYSDGVFWESRE